MSTARPLGHFENPALAEYFLDHAFDEMFAEHGGIRPQYQELLQALTSIPRDELQRRKRSADVSFLTQGITFTVYGREEGTERIFPYDLLPRVITSGEWEHIEKGLTQRITALNLFLHDIYNDQRILKEKIIPEEVIRSASHFRPE